MPLYLRSRVRRRGKTLREEVLSSKVFDDTEFSSETKPRLRKRSLVNSLKGSFLRNKLDNPLFKSVFKKSALSKVQNASESDSEEEESHSSSASDSEDERIEKIESEQEKEKDEESVVSDHRWKWSFLFRQRSRVKKSKEIRLRSVSDSGSSQSRFYSASDDEAVDTLTKLEDSLSINDDSSTYVLYTDKGQAVRVKFFYDYLQITPVSQRLTLRRTRTKTKRKKKTTGRVIYYEDLALWTNNDECLKLIHIKNKHTALQQRTEIKLFVNKKVDITPKQLNDELKDRISVLMAEKMDIEVSEARRHLEKSASENDVKRVVQEIDRNGEKCVAKNLANVFLSDSEGFELMNV